MADEEQQQQKRMPFASIYQGYEGIPVEALVIEASSHRLPAYGGRVTHALTIQFARAKLELTLDPEQTKKLSEVLRVFLGDPKVDAN